MEYFKEFVQIMIIWKVEDFFSLYTTHIIYIVNLIIKKRSYLINLTQPFVILLSVKAIQAVQSFLSGPRNNS